MSTKTLTPFVIQGALYAGTSGTEAKAGDAVRLFLDQTRNAAFPEYIDGTIVLPTKRVNVVVNGCITEATSYSFQYDSDDLAGSADHIDVCDVTEASVIECCTTLTERIAAHETLGHVIVRDDLDAFVGGVAGALDNENLAAIDAGQIYAFRTVAAPTVLEFVIVEASADATAPPGFVRAADHATSGKGFRYLSLGDHFARVSIITDEFRTLSLADNGKVLVCPEESGCYMVLEESLGVGFNCAILPIGGTVTVDAGSGVSLNGTDGGATIINQGYSPTTLLQIDGTPNYAVFGSNSLVS